MAISPSKLLSQVRNDVASAANTVKHDAANVVKTATKTASNVATSAVNVAEDAFKAGKTAVTDVKTAVSDVKSAAASLGGKLDHPFVMGGDGFVAVDDQGNLSGLMPSARTREFDGPHSALDPLLQILSHGESKPISFQLPGGTTFEARTDGSGFERLPTSALPSSALAGVDAQKGGLVQVGVSSPGMASSTSNMLVLPKSYDGPIFVCDIDDTLRATSYVDVATGKIQKPIDGAQALLAEVAKQGIPIVYLSAGPDRIRPQNEAFLKQLPPGVLLDRGHAPLLSMLPINKAQARDQGAYKAQVLGNLEQTYPGAKLFGLGDNKYGDAMAYTRAGATAYIHQVQGNQNLPADFHGTETKSYDPAFISKVSSDLKAAVAQSASFGGKPGAVDPMAAISAQLDQVSGSKLTTGNTVEPFIDGENAFPQILSTLDGAKKSIDYESYQFIDGDKTSSQVVDHLLAAKARGVNVRVQVDALGSRELPWKSNGLMDKLQAAGIPVTVYHPLTDVKQTVEYHRDHRKSIIVDGSTAIIGGMNTGDIYMGGPEVQGRLHDVMCRLKGPAVADVQNAFNQSWQAGGGAANPPPPVPSTAPASEPGVPMRVITHAPGDENIRATYLTLIDHAKTSLNVENTYPLADDMTDALCAAAQRGVNVRYVIGTGQGALDVAAEKNFPKLLAAGVHVYLYPEGIHTKSMSVDGQIATFGSSNVDNVALDRDREIIGLVQDPAFTRTWDAAMFDKDVVGDGRGKKTIEVTRWDPGLWTNLKNKLLTGIWPNSYE